MFPMRTCLLNNNVADDKSANHRELVQPILKVDDNYQTKQIIRNMFPSPIWILKYLGITWKLSFTLISTNITSTKWFKYNCPLKRFLIFFFCTLEQIKFERKKQIWFLLKFFYLEIKDIKLMCQHILHTFSLQIHEHNSDILGEKWLQMFLKYTSHLRNKGKHILAGGKQKAELFLLFFFSI